MKEVKGELSLRKISNEDCFLLFKWVNDSDVRKNAINQEKIKWKDHKEWFLKKLINSETRIFILEKDNEPVGQIRYDRIDNYWEISLSIAKKFRGCGFGKSIIDMSRNRVPGPLIAKVKEENIASQKVFEKLGFRRETKKDNLVRYVYLK